MTLKLSTNVVIQVCGIIAQIGNGLMATTGVLSPKAAIVVGGIVAIAQAVSAYFGHLSTPEGTPVPKP